MRRLYTTDTKALNHVLMNSNDYQKPEAARYSLNRVVGTGMYSTIYTTWFRLYANMTIQGVLVVEGEKHKQQV